MRERSLLVSDVYPPQVNYLPVAGQAVYSLYCDGVLAGSRSDAPAINSNGELLIGSYFGSQQLGWLPGAVDDVVAFNRTLFSLEVLALSAREPANLLLPDLPLSNGLVLMWTFEADSASPNSIYVTDTS